VTTSDATISKIETRKTNSDARLKYL